MSVLLQFWLFSSILSLNCWAPVATAGGPSKKDDVFLASGLGENSPTDATIWDHLSTTKYDTPGFTREIHSGFDNNKSHNDFKPLNASLFPASASNSTYENDDDDDDDDPVDSGEISTSSNQTDSIHKCQLYVENSAVADPVNCSIYQEQCIDDNSFAKDYADAIVRTVTSECPNGRLYDSIDKECVKGSDAYCGVYNCTQLDGFFPDPKNNAKFIHCFNGVPKRKVCEPNGTRFNSHSKICEWIQEELPTGLKMFKIFISFVAFTSDGNSTDDGFINSPSEYIITILIAASILLIYLATVITIHNQFNSGNPKGIDDPMASDAEDFYRYYTRPNPLYGTTGARGFTSSSTRAVDDAHVATTTF